MVSNVLGFGVMLVNCYVLYCSAQLAKETAKKDLISHHDFRQDVALRWINPALYQKEKSEQTVALAGRKRRILMSTCPSVSSFTMSDTMWTPPKIFKNEGKTRHVTDNSLGLDGSINICLRKEYAHQPTQPNGTRVRCNLHCWAGVETQKGVLCCGTCGVNLCIKCWSLFHSEINVERIRLLMGDFGC